MIITISIPTIQAFQGFRHHILLIALIGNQLQGTDQITHQIWPPYIEYGDTTDLKNIAMELKSSWIISKTFITIFFGMHIFIHSLEKFRLWSTYSTTFINSIGKIQHKLWQMILYSFNLSSSSNINSSSSSLRSIDLTYIQVNTSPKREDVHALRYKNIEKEGVHSRLIVGLMSFAFDQRYLINLPAFERNYFEEFENLRHL